MVKLPQEFSERMQRQLGGEFEPFLAALGESGYAGLRVNTRKISVEAFLRLTPFQLTPVPWTDNGFYYRKEEPVTRHPHYFAGLYYIQEPSAMLPAAVLPVEPGDVVLDLCAAPGGKATELSLRLGGEGLLVANDASPSRAKALLKNLTVWGAGNCCITGETPQRLLDAFGCFFDKILVDAPCSGEGMFRRDPALIEAWKERGPEAYAPLQKEILSCAVQMLKPGGFLVYSTCTFSEAEDEEVVEEILDKFPEMELCRVPTQDGFAAGGSPCGASVRIWPHRVKGEGHFAALLRRRPEGDAHTGGPQEASMPADRACSWEHDAYTGEPQGDALRGMQRIEAQETRRETACRTESSVSAASRTERKTAARKQPCQPQGKIPAEVREFLDLLPERIWKDCIYEQIGEQCLLLPPYALPGKLRYLRTGILAGTLRRGRFEPSQALAMLLDAESFPRVVNLSSEDMRTERYLKGETIELGAGDPAVPNGWVLVCTDGFALGWGKYADGRVKNKYYPGWRLQG